MALRSRRDEYSDASYRALLDSARQRFAALGFAATSLDDVAADARLTKGAVYHHFASKQALFQSVLSLLEDETVRAITAASQRAAAAGASAWDAALAGLDAFLTRCLDPGYQRICFLEGPRALGFASWWEMGERHEISLIRSMVAALHRDGLIETDDINTLTRLIFGSLLAAALDIAGSPEPAETQVRVRAAVTRLIWGLRPPRAWSHDGAAAPPPADRTQPALAQP
jgi:AcrR family transcriptional regulator